MGDYCVVCDPGTYQVSALQPGMTGHNVLRIISGAGSVLIVPSPEVTVTAPPNTSISEACLQTAAPLAPSSRSGWGMPPQFLPLLFGWLGGRAALEYDVRSTGSLPYYGQVRTEMSVQLREVRVRPNDGARLLRGQIDPDAIVIDKQGSHLPLAHIHPELYNFSSEFFFWQMVDGTVSSLLHHPDEHERTVATKKHMAALFQLKTRELGTRRLRELDARGETMTRYSVGRGLFGRLNYRKQLRFATTSEGMLKHAENVTAIVDELTGVVRKLHTRHLMSIERAAFAMDGMHGSPGDMHLDGLDDAVPKEPQLSTWTLRPLARESLRRGLSSDQISSQPPAEFVESTIAYASPSPLRPSEVKPAAGSWLLVIVY